MKIKNNFIAVVFLLSFTITGYAQEKAPVSKFKTNNNFDMYMGFNFSPDLCYRSLKNTNGSASSEDIINKYNKKDAPLSGFTVGASICNMYTKYLGYEIGFLYSSKGYQSQNDTFISGAVNPRRGYTYANTNPITSIGKTVYRYSYFDVPFKLVILAGKKRVRFTGSAGIIISSFLRATISYSGSDSSGASVSGKRSANLRTRTSFNIAPVVSAGIDYRLSENTFLKIEPIIRYSISRDVNENAPIGIHLWNAGINFSYYIGF